MDLAGKIAQTPLQLRSRKTLGHSIDIWWKQFLPNTPEEHIAGAASFFLPRNNFFP